MKKRTMMLLLAVVLLGVWYAATAAVASDRTVKAHGVLISVENDGTVVIDDR